MVSTAFISKNFKLIYESDNHAPSSPFSSYCRDIRENQDDVESYNEHSFDSIYLSIPNRNIDPNNSNTSYYSNRKHEYSSYLVSEYNKDMTFYMDDLCLNFVDKNIRYNSTHFMNSILDKNNLTFCEEVDISNLNVSPQNMNAKFPNLIMNLRELFTASQISDFFFKEISQIACINPLKERSIYSEQGVANISIQMKGGIYILFKINLSCDLINVQMYTFENDLYNQILSMDEWIVRNINADHSAMKIEVSRVEKIDQLSIGDFFFGQKPPLLNLKNQNLILYTHHSKKEYRDDRKAYRELSSEETVSFKNESNFRVI